MNPFLEMNTEIETEDNLPLLKEFAWDFVHDTFLYNSNGTLKEVIENEALKVWIYKALKTERYKHEAYLHGNYNNDSSYGVELEQYIGNYSNTNKTATLICKKIKECLSINPYIKSIDYVDVELIDGDKLTISLKVTSIYGNLEQKINL